MTLLRLGDGDLFVHSPTPLTDGLRDEIAALGTPRWIIGPNRIHYWWIPEWKRAFPDAGVWLAPRIRERAGARIAFAPHPLHAGSRSEEPTSELQSLMRNSYAVFWLTK